MSVNKKHRRNIFKIIIIKVSKIIVHGIFLFITIIHSLFFDLL